MLFATKGKPQSSAGENQKQGQRDGQNEKDRERIR